MAHETKGTNLELVERELSRLLNYAYAGFLALLIFHFVESDLAEKFRRDLGWELVVLACIVIGAGIYRAHRSAIIPIHHLFACYLFWVWDERRLWRARKPERTKGAESVSPTRWFGSLGVEKYRRILAYNTLRHDAVFLTLEEQKRLDLMHAEFGLVVMAAEACIFGAAYAGYKLFRFHSLAWWVPLVWLVVGIVVFAASYPAPMQEHAIECLRWRTREKEGDEVEVEKDGKKIKTKIKNPVTTTLKKYGLLAEQSPSNPANPAP
ncbi:MAG: hypothetical protein AUH11_07680 [Acidobacteria bacterium 13_2_20CM_57_17]|nr:MAG: hypothetical protein AUH11_07680 [Acidobacteria bacterium 13_2_20CM_57_17]OLB92183.1 MAG: hypothetical protein AUI02_08530 [Acidobacteria bacterium 13_2_20CM_2_57_12]OLE16569.1 MAG: hypothetical protein AUG83_02600 [Acidobacteria bacterium 13_1_20CM_4_57_11]